MQQLLDFLRQSPILPPLRPTVSKTYDPYLWLDDCVFSILGRIVLLVRFWKSNAWRVRGVIPKGIRLCARVTLLFQISDRIQGFSLKLNLTTLRTAMQEKSNSTINLESSTQFWLLLLATTLPRHCLIVTLVTSAVNFWSAASTGQISLVVSSCIVGFAKLSSPLESWNITRFSNILATSLSISGSLISRR